MSMLRSDLPLDRDAAGFFLPAIIGFMVFLAALALAGSMGLDNLLARWRSQIDTAFTIELPPIDGESAAAADGPAPGRDGRPRRRTRRRERDPGERRGKSAPSGSLAGGGCPGAGSALARSHRRHHQSRAAQSTSRR